MKRILPLVIAGLLSARWVGAEEPAAPPPVPQHERPAMTDEQRVQKQEQLDKTWNSMSLEQKSHLMRLHRALREMPPEDRRFVHDRIERFLNMSPKERERLKQNREKWEKMSPEEREQARQKLREGRQQFEEKWRQEHPGEEPPPFPFHRQKGPSPEPGNSPE